MVYPDNDRIELVTWDPDHAGQGHAESHPLCPLGVHVVVPILDRGVADAVEDEHSLNNCYIQELQVSINKHTIYNKQAWPTLLEKDM